jgi:hypothetical protein
MKSIKIIFLFVFLLTVKMQAQHSDLYNYIDSLTKSIQFPRSNVFKTKYVSGFTKDNQPLLFIDDSVRVKNMGLFTKTEDLDNYTMSQVHSIQIWNKGSWMQRNALGAKGLYGAIFVYTKAYVFPNPSRPTVAHQLMADEDDENKKVVIYLAPVVVSPINDKGKKK